METVLWILIAVVLLAVLVYQDFKKANEMPDDFEEDFDEHYDEYDDNWFDKNKPAV